MTGLYQKNPNMEEFRTIFLKKTMDLDLLGFPITLEDSEQKKVFFTLGKTVKLCYTPWKCQGQKPRPMKIQQSFALENSVKLRNTF